jgi:GntR family transcriptional regulator
LVYLYFFYDNLLKTRRGLGMYVNDGARAALLKSERERFLREEWPVLHARLGRLGLSLKELMDELKPEDKQ